MTIIQKIRLTDIFINPDKRFRKEFSLEVLAKMQESIGRPPGLMNAIAVTQLGDNGYEIVFGETRYKSVDVMHDLGQTVYYNGEQVEDGFIPAMIVPNNLTEVQLLRVEMEENTIRQGFTYLEEQMAVSKIFALETKIKSLEAAESLAIPVENLSPDTVKTIKKEAMDETIVKAFNVPPSPAAIAKTQLSLQVAEAMTGNAVLAEKMKHVSNDNEAKKVLTKHAQDEHRAVLANTVGRNFTSNMHTVIHGDCLDVMKKMLEKDERFDVCCTDPIYGINADKFGNAAGKMSGQTHSYDDSLETFKAVLPKALNLMSQLMKPASHVYLACDIRNYHLLAEFLKASGDPRNPWNIPNAPVIQYKIAGGRVPIPGFTFRRSYEVWLYAYRGGKQEYRMLSDVIECESDRTEDNGAGKPVDLLKTLLARSALTGDKILDFMAGSGSILVAAHALKMRCTAIEINATDYGRCLERVKNLK